MDIGITKKVPFYLKALIGTVLEVNGIDLTRVKTVWAQQLSLQKVPGAAGVVYLEPDEYYIVVNVPVLVMPVRGRILTYTELMHFATKISDIPTAQYAIRDNVFYLTFCLPDKEVKESQVFETVNQAISMAEAAQQELLEAILAALPPLAESDGNAEVTLPNVKMKPADAEVIFDLFARATSHARKIYTVLMEQWEKAGYFIETTPTSVVFEIPYGIRRARLCMLLWGGNAREPLIGLFWDALRKQTGFPRQALEDYQAKVKALVPLRTTPSAAYIVVKSNFTVSMARQLVKLMVALAHSVQHDQVEKPAGTRTSSEMNIELTLNQCSPELRSIFQILIDGWLAVGGTVQCKKVGRIYLKMTTYYRMPPSSGVSPPFQPEPLIGSNDSDSPDLSDPFLSSDQASTESRFPLRISFKLHQFALAVLVSPATRGGPAIHLAWNLATGSFPYLDYIPLQVSIYEKLVSSLPGFFSKGAITGLIMGETFREEHARRLLSAMADLKKAEWLSSI